MNFLRKWWARRVLNWHNICPIHMKTKSNHGSLYDVWALDRCCDDCWELKEQERAAQYSEGVKRAEMKVQRAKEVLGG